MMITRGTSRFELRTCSAASGTPESVRHRYQIIAETDSKHWMNARMLTVNILRSQPKRSYAR